MSHFESGLAFRGVQCISSGRWLSGTRATSDHTDHLPGHWVPLVLAETVGDTSSLFSLQRHSGVPPPHQTGGSSPRMKACTLDTEREERLAPSLPQHSIRPVASGVESKVGLVLPKPRKARAASLRGSRVSLHLLGPLSRFICFAIR